MDRADYFEAKAALLNLELVLVRGQAQLLQAQVTRDGVLRRLGIPLDAPGYRWDDTTLEITPVGQGHGG